MKLNRNLRAIATAVVSLSICATALTACNIVPKKEDDSPYSGAAVYTLSEFNELNFSSIPNDIETLVINLDDCFLTDDKPLVIGNGDNTNGSLADFCYAKPSTDLTEGERADTVAEKDGYSLISAANKGYTVVLKGGSVTAADKSSPKDVLAGIKFYVSDSSTIILDGITFTGTLRFICERTQIVTADNGTEFAYSHRIKNLIVKNCIFSDGAIFQDSEFAENTVVENCFFSGFTNDENTDASNPVWLQNFSANGLSVKIKNCTFNSSRPLKLTDGNIDGSSVTVYGNDFYVSSKERNKNVALYFGSAVGKANIIDVKNNSINDDTVALLAFADETCVSNGYADSFNVIGNIKWGANLGVLWNTDVPFMPSSVNLY